MEPMTPIREALVSAIRLLDEAHQRQMAVRVDSVGQSYVEIPLARDERKVRFTYVEVGGIDGEPTVRIQIWKSGRLYPGPEIPVYRMEDLIFALNLLLTQMPRKA